MRTGLAAAVPALCALMAAAPGAAGRDRLDIRLFARVGPPGQPEPVAIGPDGLVYVGTNQLGKGDADGPSPRPRAQATPPVIRRLPLLLATAALTAGPAKARWKPRPTTGPWQVQLQGRPNLDVRARVFEFDGDETSRRVVRRLHRRRRRAICYVNAGAWEDFRRDAGEFPREVLGKAYAGYPDERWLDIRRIDLLAPPLRARIETCRRKGFDAVDPDNVDGYSQDTGFPLTAEDQLEFNRWLADEIHRRGMAAILKNDGPQVEALVRRFDGAVVEECFQFGECDQHRPFVRARKPVYAIEYRRRSRRVCRSAKRRRFSVIFKRKSLRAYRQAC